MTENLAGRGEGLAGLRERMHQRAVREKVCNLRGLVEASRNGFLNGQPYILTYSDISSELSEIVAALEAAAPPVAPDTRYENLSLLADNLAEQLDEIQEICIDAGIEEGTVKTKVEAVRKLAEMRGEAAAPPSTAPPELLCVNCGHSYAQHTKGINHPQKYCRHCSCLEWAALKPQPYNSEQEFGKSGVGPSVGSPRKVGEDGASEALHHAIRLLKVLPKPIYKDYDDIRRECEELISWYHAEYGTASPPSVRPSSVPVGEQKQEEGV